MQTPSPSSSAVLPTHRNLIDGKLVAAVLREEVQKEVSRLFSPLSESSSHLLPRPPHLTVVLVGDRTDSATYVRMKQKACAECGISSELIKLPPTATQEEIVKTVRRLNTTDTVDGILVQLPMPDGICEKVVLLEIDASKDVDGLHPFNVGSLALRGHDPVFKPCTAEGAIELLRRYDVKLSGAEVVVVGRSNIVGMPISLLLQQENATVTMCHSRTEHIDQYIKKADIVIAAMGKARYIKGEWLKHGAVVIDVGINAVDAPGTPKGYRLVGDVDFEEAVHKCKLITPVPGGVGPMTVAMLMKNSLEARKHNMKQRTTTVVNGVLSTISKPHPDVVQIINPDLVGAVEHLSDRIYAGGESSLNCTRETYLPLQ